jgi:hypothetical protein
MSDRFLRNLLKSKGFSADIAKQIEKAVEKKAKMDSEQKELRDRELAMAMTKDVLNQVLPHLRKAMEQKPVKKIIIPGEND